MNAMFISWFILMNMSYVRGSNFKGEGERKEYGGIRSISVKEEEGTSGGREGEVVCL